ncbi:MAG: [protein-PII] uridylyltransferase, partial [Nitrospinaceae bacterium]
MNPADGQYRFGIDFSPVREIPENPRDRSSYFSAYKALIKQEQGKIRAWHRGGVGGREVIQAHTALMDEIIRHLTVSLASLKHYADANVLGEFALAAVGGYGRGELNPCSDIDLLFLRPSRIRKITDEFIQDLISIFWGIGLEIGHSCRSVKECLLLAREDLTIKTSMIETRFLIGNQDKYEKFCDSFQRSVLKKSIQSFLNIKLKEKQNRHCREGGVVCIQEPNIKEGPGGLRDYHTALWAAAARFGCHSLHEIGRNDVISDQEVDALYESVNFVLRVRNEMHYIKDKKADVLSLDLQKDLALNLGYPAENDVIRVEKFMHDYFLHAMNIFNFSKTVFDLCLHSSRSFKTVLSSLTQKSLGNGFIAKDHTLAVEGDVEDLFPRNKTLLLELFYLCRKHGLEPNHQLKRQIRRHVHLIDEAFLQGNEVKEFLFATLRDSASERILRQMHEMGVLNRILPEFGRSHCMVSYDFYHRYTADEHSLRMVRFLEDLATHEGSDLGELAEIYASLSAKPLLKFAALLQTIGKNHGSDPSSEMTGLLAPIGERMGLSSSERDTLDFLIRNQNEMIETALHKDMHQPTVIEEFGRLAANRERLDLLYLFSYADLRAVAPGTWTSWKKVLLSELYHRTRQYLERPDSLNEQPQATRDEVYRTLHWECPASEIERHLNQLPEDYLLSASPGEVALHIRLIRSLKGKSFILHHEFNEAGSYHHLILCCQAKLEAFKKLVGTLTAKNMNILGAQIYLKKDGIVIISIQVEETQRLGPDNLEIWKEVKQILGDVLEGRKSLRTLLASRGHFTQKKGAPRAIVPKIQIDNTSFKNFTVIRIEARDHLGLLYKIARTFADFNIRVHRAKISTQGDRGIDVFYVTLRDRKVTFQKLIRRIKEKTIHVLLTENLG